MNMPVGDPYVGHCLTFGNSKRRRDESRLYVWGLKTIHNSEISNTLQWDLDYTAVESKIDNQRVYERNRTFTRRFYLFIINPV